MERAIPGYPGYSVTSCGNVRGPRRHLTPQHDRRGYLRVWAYVNGKRMELYVRKAVALAWVPGDSALTVNHVDGNKTNNNASNLEWISKADNLRHGFRIGLFSANRGKKRGKSFAIDPVLLSEMADMADMVRSGRSMRSVAMLYGMGPKTFQYQMKMNGGVL